MYKIVKNFQFLNVFYMWIFYYTQKFIIHRNLTSIFNQQRNSKRQNISREIDVIRKRFNKNYLIQKKTSHTVQITFLQIRQQGSISTSFLQMESYFFQIHSSIYLCIPYEKIKKICQFTRNLNLNSSYERKPGKDAKRHSCVFSFAYVSYDKLKVRYNLN